MSDLASRRADYESAGLDVGDVANDPIAQWQQWYDQASQAGCAEPNAFVLSTVDGTGWPQSRYLLARGADERGFAFFTNYESSKSEQLSVEPRASMLFTWLQLHRQTRVAGVVERLPDVESDAVLRVAASVVADRRLVVAAVAGASRSGVVGGTRRPVRADVRECR